MKTKLIAIAGVVATVLLTTVQADPITGTTGFTGSFTPSNPDLTTSGDVITITSQSLNGIASGSFVGGVLTQFSSPITLNNPVNPTFSQPLWTVTVGTHVYTFVSTTDTTVLDTPNINTIVGTGTVTDSLDGDTADGTYNLSFNVTQAGGGATFTWNGTSGSTTPPPSVPDGGMSAMLLGAALSAMALIRRKLTA